jgi:signal transduction histidine kinase
MKIGSATSWRFSLPRWETAVTISAVLFERKLMNLSEFLAFLPLASAVGYTILLLVLFLRRSQQELALRWMLAFLCASVAWAFLLFFMPLRGLPGNLPLKALLVGTIFLAMVTAVFVRWPHQKYLLILSGIAISAAFLVDVFVPNQIFRLFPTSTWAVFTVSSIISFLTWFALGSMILLRTWRDYRRAAFPWHANRLLFWALTLLVVFSGEAMLFARFTGLSLAGQIVRFVGVVGLVYAVSSHRVFDVRTVIRRGIAYLIVVLLTALPLTGLILLVQALARVPLQPALFAVTAVTIVAGFILYQPLRGWVERITYRYLFGESFNPGQIVRDYSQAVSRTLDVAQLAQVVLSILSDKFETNRGALMLVTGKAETVEIQPVPGLGDVPREPVSLPLSHALIQALLVEQQPLLQYELDFNPAYHSIAAEAVGDWLKGMAMEAYVPVTDGSGLDGIIAIGPKRSGVPYQPGELGLMQLLADQTVVALQNARLYTELEGQNQHIKHLNVDLTKQNERFAIMDKVKSDFITIASHELRTPLTQVKGYADILAAMNEGDSLNRDQTREIVGHINRATTRLEGLISAMLDASQIDASGMQLTYMETKMETIVRLANEPLLNALRDRRIDMRASGLSELPPLYADFKRLVQTFTNLLGNAVKYTPDHGNILVSGTLLPGRNGVGDHLEIVVADSGIGIDSRYHELIFEKFFRVGDPQLHSTGNTKFKGAGPGLGLTIAKGVIEAHNGRIWVESEGEDERRCPGSRFHVILPLCPPGAKEQMKQQEKAAGERPSWLVG